MVQNQFEIHAYSNTFKILKKARCGYSHRAFCLLFEQLSEGVFGVLSEALAPLYVSSLSVALDLIDSLGDVDAAAGTERINGLAP